MNQLTILKAFTKMMRLIIIGICLFVMNVANAENDSIKTTEINKIAGSFKQELILQSSPVELELSCALIDMSGEIRKFRDLSTYEYHDFLRADAADIKVSEKIRLMRSNRIIVEQIVYRDSVAAVITFSPDNKIYYMRYCWIENDKWVNAGEDLEFSLTDAKAKAHSKLSRLEKRRVRVKQIMNLPTDVASFVKYLKANAQTPVEYVLSALSTHKLVINGEYHRRKVSWDMLMALIGNPRFPAVAGTIFMELPSHRQSDIDAFMQCDTLNSEAILEIFRDEQPNGWWDKGEYEFLCRLWAVNKSLPENKKITVRLVDFQLPYSSIKSKAEFDSLQEKDRNTHMATLISDYITTKTDGRNALFLVGCGHATKAKVSDLYSGGDNPAGAQLVSKLGANNVFTIFQHNFTGDNLGRYKQPIRYGVFDVAFAANGNVSLGIDLKDSPFGMEPFDGIYEHKFNPDAGTFADNYDGYLFLCSLNEEPVNEALVEVFSPKFVEEMKRRAVYLEMTDRKDFWFGVNAEDMTPEIIIEALK